MDVEGSGLAQARLEGSGLAQARLGGSGLAQARLEPLSAGRGRSGTLVLVTHTLILILCLGCSFHSWFSGHNQPKDDEELRGTFIYLESKQSNSKAVSTKNQTLKFYIFQKNRIELNNENTIIFPCSGPYIIYLYVYPSDKTTNKITLSLLQDNSIKLTLSPEPRRMMVEKITSFQKNDNISLNMTESHRIHLSFYYLLGHECFD